MALMLGASAHLLCCSHMLHATNAIMGISARISACISSCFPGRLLSKLAPCLQASCYVAQLLCLKHTIQGGGNRLWQPSMCSCQDRHLHKRAFCCSSSQFMQCNFMLAGTAQAAAISQLSRKLFCDRFTSLPKR